MPVEYDKKYYFQCLLGLIAMVGVMRLTQGVGFALIVPFVLVSLARDKPESMLYYLMMLIAMTMGNSNLMPKSPTFMIVQRAVTLVMAMCMVVQIAGRKNAPLLKPFLALLVYWLYMFIPSFMGWCPMISIMKQLFFFMVYMAYYGIANRVSLHVRANAPKIRGVFLAVASFFILGSIVLIPFPGISMMGAETMEQALREGHEITSLFMGMTVHSQALGPMVAIFGVMLFADMFFGVRRADRLYLLLLCCVPVLIWKTSSRTAMGAFLAGCLFVTFLIAKSRGVSLRWKSKILSSILLLTSVLVVSVLAVPKVRESAAGFILKFNRGEKRDVTVEEVTATRRGKWDLMLSNISKRPVFGNGFQVSDDYARLKISNPFQVLSAPVEKGTWILAVLEEGGVCGMSLFLLFAIPAFFTLLSRRAYLGLAAYFMMLVINLGEFTMFSMTASGGLTWAMVFLGLVLDAKRLRTIQREAAFVPWGA